jgi:alkylated DNA repair protein (DNA oxidative demethylase)
MTGRTMSDQLELIAPLDPSKEIMAEGAMLLRGAALPFETELLAALNDITATSPFRQMVTPGGHTMSVAMTNCGAAGWATNRTGYRYDRMDPETSKPWPPMPECFLALAVAAATDAGYAEFRPDACLINRYEPGARLSLRRPEAQRPGEEVRSQAR